MLHFPLGHTCPISGQAAPFHDRIMGTASPQAAFIHFCDVFRLHLALRTTHSPYGFALSGCSVDKIQRLRPYQSVRIEYIIYHSTLQYPPAIFLILRKFDPFPNRIHILCVGWAHYSGHQGSPGIIPAPAARGIVRIVLSHVFYRPVERFSPEDLIQISGKIQAIPALQSVQFGS